MSLPSRSHILHRIVLLISAVGVLAIAWWVGSRAIEPVPPPPIPPPKASVSFDPRVDVRTHPLFNTLQALYRGQLDAGIVGRANPFLGATGGLEALQEGGVSLGTIEEVALGGTRVIAASKGAEHGIVVLLQSSANERAYEIRRLTVNGAPQGLGSWVADAGALTPIALQEDRAGVIWVLSTDGRVGSIQNDGRPLWGSLPLDGVRQSIGVGDASFALDGAGRLWLTDGESVFVGNGTGFERIDLAAQLSAAHRQALGVSAEGDLPSNLRRPQRLQMMADGRVAVLTERFAATFPLNLQGSAEILVAPASAVVLEPLTGALWSVERNNAGEATRWIRSVTNGSRDFTDLVVLPKQAGVTPSLAAVDTGVLYALDYAPQGTILWSILDDTWVASVLAAEGPQPQDRAVQLIPDRDGGVWVLLSQRGLLLARPSN